MEVGRLNRRYDKHGVADEFDQNLLQFFWRRRRAHFVQVLRVYGLDNRLGTREGEEIGHKTGHESTCKCDVELSRFQAELAWYPDEDHVAVVAIDARQEFHVALSGTGVDVNRCGRKHVAVDHREEVFVQCP